MEPRILLVEGQRKKNLSCGPWLEERGHKFDRVHTRRNASAWLKSTTADLLIIDARALRFDAHRFCQALRANGENVPLLLILPAGEKHSGDSATVVLQGKITPRRFYNRVRRLLSKPGAKVLRAGPAGGLYAQPRSGADPRPADAGGLGHRFCRRHAHARGTRSLAAQSYRERPLPPRLSSHRAPVGLSL